MFAGVNDDVRFEWKKIMHVFLLLPLFLRAGFYLVVSDAAYVSPNVVQDKDTTIRPNI